MRKSRLIGTWRSDRKLTLQDIQARRDIKPKARKILEGIFGKLVLMYRQKTVVSLFEGVKTTEHYRVLGEDSGCAVIRALNPGPLGKRYVMVHFENDDCYWISLGKYREFFRRISRAPTMPSSVFRTRGTLSAGQKSRRSPKSAHG